MKVIHHTFSIFFLNVGAPQSKRNYVRDKQFIARLVYRFLQYKREVELEVVVSGLGFAWQQYFTLKTGMYFKEQDSIIGQIKKQEINVLKVSRCQRK